MPELLSGDLLFRDHAFESDVPLPDVIDTASRRTITLAARQFDQFLGLYDQFGNALTTTVWGYKAGQLGGYPGPTIVAYEDRAVTMNWQNKLPLTGHLLPIDTTIHLAMPVRRPLENGYVPLVAHLHGGHSSAAADGTAEQWFTQNGGGRGQGPRETGRTFAGSSSRYDNDQGAATLWYHDHALGMTRLNVYAGLAGFYILQDDERLALEAQQILPSGRYDLGLVIQDRAFTADGQLYLPAFRDDRLPGTTDTVGDMVPQAFYDAHGEGAPSILPEFFGDTILVNGMAWPNLDVAAGEYEFRLLNGSDSRFYVVSVSDPRVGITLVGTDGGLLPHALTISDGDGVAEPGEFLVLAPGDRVELVFNFSRLGPGETATLLNSGPEFEPFKGVDLSGALLGGAEAADAGDPVGNIMQFTVTAAIPAFDAHLSAGQALAGGFADLASDADGNGIADAATNVRLLGLFEGADEYGRIMPMLGKAEAGSIITDMMAPGDFGPLMYDAPITENPQLGATEQWEFLNFTEDAHPVHVHLVQYQVVEKREIFFVDEDENGLPDDTTGDGLISYGHGTTPDYTKADIWIGDVIPLRPEETGWQDTVPVNPGTMMSIVARFDRPGEYVWHCHILSHEDNEMMRPFYVGDLPVGQGMDYFT
ncbi:multicopper oxidase domain-containing protein [Sphingomonas sp. BN140010]|uniref:Multicopper oxidase domain-containing protein n=1 Tax=Sphingomonas arvum TaxID=2992113 RepID=A0ABT3JGP5_9SPHN|nr:multicopper oxidase domain-containing protein [Sphingomonas sp. BN140010]MCW3798262.1 multicopper oxidase domain-containing protein [Sphingomonas sp. BN140010]